MSEKVNYRILLQGGLGNQLFGWAAALSLAKKNNGTVQVSEKYLKPNQYQLGKYLFAPEIIDQSKLGHFYQIKSFREKDFTFDNRFSHINKSATLKGYFQSWKYFEHCQEYIRENVSTILNPSSQYDGLLSQLEKEPFTAIHIRRGDYVGLTSYHGLTSKQYYLRAKRIISTYQNSQKVVVFSDDIPAAKDVVDWGDTYIGKEDLQDSVETLDLMSRARNIVGSNSSFSWWGAYLRDNGSGLRIMPRPWFADPRLNDRDLLCPNWITVGI